jgi:hypothetical protein
MSYLPRVTAATHERVFREFDDYGPEACLAEITQDLERHNPELLDMITRCASDVGPHGRIMWGFGMFYRLLALQASPAGPTSLLNPLPHVTAETRDQIISMIDARGSEAFTTDGIDELREQNPELLQMAHGFASRHADYLGVMQGFALLYRSLSLQAARDRAHPH